MKQVKKVVLCPVCGACPAVEIGEKEVVIGEEGNLVRLTLPQWNDLVARIRRAELTEVPEE